MRVIKALSKTEYEQRRFDGYNHNLSSVERRAGIIMAASNPTMNLFLNLGLTAVIFVGAILISGNSGTKPGVIIAFTQYFTLLSNALLGITRLFVMYTKSAASANRIAEVLETEDDLLLLPEKDYPFRREEGYLVFDHVSFSYKGTKNNLTDISFSLPKGKTLGIIGATGSGKSTVIQLLMRFYDVNSGAIRIGGRDVRTIPAGELHELFGIAMQNDFIYADTIRENIRFGRELTDAQIKRAAELAQASDFIESFSDGYDHMLSSKGTNISGGQKQRLLISRTLAGNPSILILDDSSSALDYKTDANLRAAIAEGMQNTTTIVVAQRISSIKHADLILVLEEGAIIGMGDHEHLMANCDVYREISDSQMGGAFVE
jgi:ATP-binding cassette subfamily B protein